MNVYVTGAVRWGCLIGVLSGVEALGGELIGEGIGQLELALHTPQLVGQRVEVQTTCRRNNYLENRHSHYIVTWTVIIEKYIIMRDTYQRWTGP